MTHYLSAVVICIPKWCCLYQYFWCCLSFMNSYNFNLVCMGVANNLVRYSKANQLPCICGIAKYITFESRWQVLPNHWLDTDIISRYFQCIIVKSNTDVMCTYELSSTFLDELFQNYLIFRGWRPARSEDTIWFASSSKVPYMHAYYLPKGEIAHKSAESVKEEHYSIVLSLFLENLHC